MPMSSKVSPFLWFDGQAEAAARFYVSVFPNSRLVSVENLKAGPAEGAAIAEFEIEGLKFTALDGGPMYKITPAISFVVSCETQDEIDYYWDALTDEGEPAQCGWLQDKFGVSWQVAPAELGKLMQRNPSAVTEAFLSMEKFDLELLRKAAGDA